MSGFSIKQTDYVATKDGKQISLPRSLNIEGFKLEVLGFNFEENDEAQPVMVDASYYAPSNSDSPEVSFKFTCSPQEDGITIEIESLRVKNGEKSTGTKVFQKLLELSKHIGATELKVKAVEVGSYYWGRMGFIPEESSWQEIRSAIAKRLPDSEKEEVLNELQRENLPDFATKNSSSLLVDIIWDGILNLKSPEQVSHMEGYLQSKLGQGIPI